MIIQAGQPEPRDLVWIDSIQNKGFENFVRRSQIAMDEVAARAGELVN